MLERASSLAWCTGWIVHGTGWERVPEGGRTQRLLEGETCKGEAGGKLCLPSRKRLPGINRPFVPCKYWRFQSPWPLDSREEPRAVALASRPLLALLKGLAFDFHRAFHLRSREQEGLRRACLWPGEEKPPMAGGRG